MKNANGDVRDDSIALGRYADDGADWQFGGQPGWRRTFKDGIMWTDDGPIDEYARTFILKHFGLNAPAVAALYPLDRLMTMSPAELRSDAQARIAA